MKQTFNDQSLTLSTKIFKLFSPFAWFMKKGYYQGAFWAVMITLTSVVNDILMRHVDLHYTQTVFFRFLFGMITVLPFMFKSGLGSFKTKNTQMHVIRAIIGFPAIALICYSVNVMPLSENTTIMFAQPLFFIPLGIIFLKEKLDRVRLIATLVGFCGILVFLRPGSDTLRLVALIPVSSAILFAILDLMAKKMVTARESNVTMLFYFSLGTTITSFIPMLFFWSTPTLSEIGYLFLLGIGANLIQVCLYYAFSAADVTSLLPFRYVELIFASLFGFILFGEIITKYTLIGAALIIMSTFYLGYNEHKKEKKRV